MNRYGWLLGGVVLLAVVFQLFFRYDYRYVDLRSVRIDRLTQNNCIMPCLQDSPGANPTSEPTAQPSISTVKEIDGTSWPNLNAEEKRQAMQVGVNFYREAYNSALIDATFSDTDKIDSLSKQFAGLDAASRLYDKRVKGTHAIAFTKGISDYVTTIDAFYLKYPQYTNVPLDHLIQCLADNAKTSCNMEALYWQAAEKIAAPK